MKKIDKKFIVLFLLLLPIVAVWLLHHHVTGFTVYNDGLGYYVFDRSLIIDGNVNFTNEFQYYNASYSKLSGVSRGVNAPRTVTPLGYPEIHYTIGNSLLWLPFFLGTHAIVLMLQGIIIGMPPADGFSWPYEIAIGTATMLYGLAGIFIIYKLCKRFYSRKIALLATILTWYGTAVIWYQAVEPSMSHINSMFLNATFAYVWLTTIGHRKAWQWLGLGMIGTLIFLVRQQDAIILGLPVFELLTNAIRAFGRNINRKALQDIVTQGFLFGLGILITFIPQAFVWNMLYGQPFIYSYSGTEYAGGGWTFPQLIPFFFSPEAGMIRTPALLIGLFGLFLFTKRHTFSGRMLLGVALLQIMISSSWNAWSNGYGLRFLVGLAPFFALGMAEVLMRVKQRSTAATTYGLVAVLVTANLVSMVIFLLAEVGTKLPPAALIERLLAVL